MILTTYIQYNLVFEIVAEIQLIKPKKFYVSQNITASYGLIQLGPLSHSTNPIQ